MAGGETAAPAVEAASKLQPVPAIRRAGTVVGLAGAFGLVGQLLFYGVGLGINYPVAMTLLLLGGWLVRDPARSWARLDGSLALAAITYAAFVAVRADTTMLLLDVLASLALAGAALAAIGGRAVVARPFSALLALGVGIAGWVATGAAPAVRAAGRRLPSGRSVAERVRPAMPIVRGILIAAPIVLVFVILFAAADAVFAHAVEGLLEVDVDLGELPGRFVLATVLAWAAAGAIALVASEPPSFEQTAPAARATQPRAWRLGSAEAVTVIAIVDVLFVAFVALQAAYLFGGRDTLAEIGMTYSEYARRGFFELVTAAVLAGGLVVVLDRTVRRRAVALVAGSVTLAVLTCVVLGSATLRLRLYQEAYGWTELRLYVVATIAVLAIGLVTLIAALAADRVRWIGHVMVAAALVIGLALNVLGPARFIADQNVARVLDLTLVPEHGWSGFDATYALGLGDEAIPALIRAVPHLPDYQAAYVRAALGDRLATLRGQEGLNAWQARNAGRATARGELEGAAERGELDEP
jgi:hypothetical protein